MELRRVSVALRMAVEQLAEERAARPLDLPDQHEGLAPGGDGHGVGVYDQATMSPVEAVVTHHRSGFRSGVARFNELLAERLGVPLYGLDDDGPGWNRSLLSFKVGELDIAARAALAERLDGW